MIILYIILGLIIWILFGITFILIISKIEKRDVAREDILIGGTLGILTIAFFILVRITDKNNDKWGKIVISFRDDKE